MTNDKFQQFQKNQEEFEAKTNERLKELEDIANEDEEDDSQNDSISDVDEEMKDGIKSVRSHNSFTNLSKSGINIPLGSERSQRNSNRSRRSRQRHKASVEENSSPVIGVVTTTKNSDGTKVYMGSSQVTLDVH